MTSRTHNAIAFGSLVVAAGLFPPESLNLPTFIACIIGNNIGGLLPDMDTSGNYLWGLLPQGDTLGKYLRKIFYKHRTITHSLLGLFLIYNFFNWLLPVLFNSDFIDSRLVLISIMIGFVSHLLSDSLTEEGIPLLFPLRIAFGIPPIKRVRIKTGQWFENLVIFPGVWVLLFVFVQKNYSSFINILKMVR
jgi:inner membrane protein